MHADSACTSNADSLKRHGTKYRQKTSFTYLGANVTDIPNQSNETDRRIQAGGGSSAFTRGSYTTALKQVCCP